MENPQDASFGVLRGGILGDAPGLGKTITTLALIASTAGTRPVVQSVVEPSHAEAIADGWTALRTNQGFNSDLIKTLKDVRHWADDQTDPEKYKEIQDLTRKIQLPFRDDRFLTHQEFRREVLRTLYATGVSPSVVELFRWKFECFKETLDKNRRSFYKSKADRRLLLERSLIPSAATLIIVPDALMEHWFQQIHSHLSLKYFVDGNYSSNDAGNGMPHGVVYLDGIGDIADTNAQLRNVNLDQVMAPAAVLSATYLIVITTFSRCEREFRREQRAGRFRALRRNNSGTESRGRKRIKLSRLLDGETDGNAVASDREPQSSLLQARWLRLMVDEGHALGAHDSSEQGITQIIHEIAAERRWVLSGTPTVGNRDSEEYTAECMDQLQRLFCFLRHPEYGAVRPADSDLKPSDLNAQHDLAFRKWEDEVKDPFLQIKERGRATLLRVLKSVSVIHQKEDINLPLPIFVEGDVTISVPQSRQQEIVQAASPAEAQQRLDNYMATDEYQSLVDEAQADHIVASIQRARERVRQLPNNASSVERRPVKAVIYSSSNTNLLSVAVYLYQQLKFENIAETSGDANDSTKELSRFRNGVKNVATCPICGDTSEVDVDARPRCKRVLMEVLQMRAGRQRQRLLIEPERIVGDVERVGGFQFNVPAARYQQDRRLWRPHDRYTIDTRDTHPVFSARESTETWESWGSRTCKERAARDRFEGSNWYFGRLPQTEEDTMTVRLLKFTSCSAFHNPSRWYLGPVLADAPVTAQQEDVFILCLAAELSHGLDLSFVTHMYLLEPIDDAATLEQVTSRAHRLGATGPVTVETVNVWRDISEETKNAVVKPTNESRNTERAVCQHCFRSFESLTKAEEHEVSCPRNKDSNIQRDDFDLASVYREIRPPPALSAIAQGTQ